MAEQSLNERMRSLPGVDEVLADAQLDAVRRILPHAVLADAIREAMDAAREKLRRGEEAATGVSDIAAIALRSSKRMLSPSLRRVINASGVVVHTNLGRSVLAESAVEAVVSAARGYSTLEYSVEGMQRGSRHDHCESLICALTGAEGAIAVNNNAAAVMMVLSEFAAGHEAVVSRGQLVEIGGSFRIPDIMELSGARMVEVGTTNKTHAFDYERAITDDTAMLLQVHTSNYRLVGFTETVPTRELCRIADEARTGRAARNVAAQTPDLLVYEDLGSGALLDIPRRDEPDDDYGDAGEPTVGKALGSGCDLVSFSGDKLLGGPQAGIIVGRKPLIERLKKNPLARALRLDKMTIAALEATLRLYLNPETARASIPTLRMLDEPLENTRARADSLAKRIEEAVDGDCAQVEVVEEVGRAGGGSLPMYDIPTFAVQLSFKRGGAQRCEEYLIRRNSTPIIARIKQEHVLFDARTLVDEGELDEIARALAAYFATEA